MHVFYRTYRIYNEITRKIDAADLQPGAMILSLDGDYGIIESVVVGENANQPMYNLTVDEAHTFFIGNGDWLVHNTCRVVFNNNKLVGIEDDLPGYDGVKVPGALTPDEMVQLTREYNIEFVLGRERYWSNQTLNYDLTGDYWLHSGDLHGVIMPVSKGDVAMESIYHTHPSGKTTPSTADIIDLLARAWQAEAGIIPIENRAIARVNPYNRLTPPVD